MTYQKTDKDSLINEIIDIEFSMFDKVKGMNGRAPCQNNFKTFYLNTMLSARKPYFHIKTTFLMQVMKAEI